MESALTEIFSLAGNVSKRPPNKCAITSFSPGLEWGEATVTRNASAKALDPLAVAADAL
jgi:hypothetical protein